ncbi:MAG TPA: NAD(P)/FAD-dependent oxidoreductase [Candidatus Desulfofervidus auxilii]|uniref:NAD(P)/FAD-dependent oxidoreductase n=1 Tax=Desulfofervidus auxilii TaxID=1621989 RepID=A0A7C0U2D2_DESA2|nr:NAD(P)/FAD-dependent oxidoreductase [Candidatus Desulfofervidus auxilii]
MKKAVIIGAGPAGLTAALELLKTTEIIPLVFETDSQVGGISKTISYKDYRMDIGGHRFFSKSKQIIDWWFKILPPAGAPAKDDIEFGRQIPLFANGPDPEKEDKVMLVRKRLSHIFYENKLFPYPLNFSLKVIKNLGFFKILDIITGYIYTFLFPKKPEISLEDFFINRFGRPLYEMFFKDYTYKVWGKNCSEIDALWGRQRIKGLNVKKALIHALKSNKKNIFQKKVETTLINYFLYPKYGPGQLWEEVTKRIKQKGGKVYTHHKIEKIFWEGNKIIGVEIRNLKNGKKFKLKADYFFSSMPIKELIFAFEPKAPENIIEIAANLPYRDFVTVGIFLEEINFPTLEDNWIYVQDKDVALGRIQFFHNWSPYLVPEKKGLWLGLEYFCSEKDKIWGFKKKEMLQFAKKELMKLGLIKKESWVKWGVVVKVKKAYPAYWGSYYQLYKIREFVDNFENLFLIGRNGMHRYNNQDHSMLSAIEAVKNVIYNYKDKENIWQVNVESTYYEEGRFK